MEGYLHLQNGETFTGTWLTDLPAKDLYGEIVFYTGMTGYQEVLTDPSYKDQIIVFTYPLIGNYGINEHDFESLQPHVAGVVVYEANETLYHYEAKYTLKQYLQKWNIPMIGHIDTRGLVKSIRDKGSMPAILSKQTSAQPGASLLTDHKINKVSPKETRSFGKGSTHIVLVDFGCKKSIITAMVDRGCRVTAVPYNTPFHKIEALHPDGILLSNGPGDPKDVAKELPTIKKLIYHYPVLGICLGHQLTALALGGNTEKLLFGHRGANHPVIDKRNNKIFMSSQNHSYVVDKKSLHGTGLSVRFENLHDNSVEGLVHQSLSVQTVQFHPEANPGPSDSEYIFDEFLEMIKAKNGRIASYA